MAMKKISIKLNASLHVEFQRTEHFMNIAYCLCLTMVPISGR